MFIEIAQELCQLEGMKGADTGFDYQANSTAWMTIFLGLIARARAKYKRRLLLKVFENIEAEKKSIYIVYILTAMR